MNSTGRASADVGMIGLGVMGRNLALNLADHGYSVAAFDVSPGAMTRLLEEDRRETPQGKPGKLSGSASMKELIDFVRRPRVLIVLVPSGKPVDAVCENLIKAGIESDDIVVDCGNSLWSDTNDRAERYSGRLTFFGSGISGGEAGARFGPSLMAGGDAKAWRRLKPIWESIAARVDPQTGRPLTPDPGRPDIPGIPGKPIHGGEPCAAYLGPRGAGHYVKMVHNGIEYADLQIICEAYHILRECLALPPEEFAEIFAEWNQGELESYLIEIAAEVLRQRDPDTGKPIVDVILDRAGQKGTGRWTAIDALNRGVPAATIAEAVFARSMSAMRDERIKAARSYSASNPSLTDELMKSKTKAAKRARDMLIDAVRDGLYCSRMCAYAQGFQLMRAAQSEPGWGFDFAAIARIWRGGCIIRARVLQQIAQAFDANPDLENLLLDPGLHEEIDKRQADWRSAILTAVERGVPVPALASSLAWFDSYRSARLPTNLLQAIRDFFGAHTYERVDAPAGTHFHLEWTKPGRPQVEAK